MEIITIRGKYSYDSSKHFQGLIVLFQFESLDRKDEYEMASKQIVKESLEKDLILVPFSHISNDVKEFYEAKEYTEQFYQLCKNNKNTGNVYLAPFGVSKELNISSDGIADVKFRRFEGKDKSRIQNLYNAQAEIYDRHMKETGHYSAQAKVADELKEYIRENIMDLGSGTGFLANYLLDKNYVDYIFINDFSKNMIDIARERVPNDKCSFSYFDASTKITLPVKFNTLICCNLFFYLNSRVDIIGNWKKLLSSDGNIILIEEFPFLFPIGEEIDTFSKDLKTLHKYIKPNEIIDLFKKNSFTLNKQIQVKIDEKHSLYGYVFHLQD